MSSAVKAVKKVAKATLDPTTYFMASSSDKASKAAQKGLSSAMGIPQGGGIAKPDAKLDEPAAAPILDDEEMLRARQKELARRTSAGRASTVMSGGSGLG
jgi:hypothetical protein